MGYSFRLAARVLLYAPSQRQDNTYHGICYTSRGALAGTRNSSVGPLHEGSIRRTIAPWANALTTELHLAPSVPWDTYPLCLESLNQFLLVGWRVWMLSKHEHPSYPTCVLLGTRLVSMQVTATGWRYWLQFFQPVLHDWCNKGRDMCYPLCGMMDIKESLLLIGKSSPCGDSGFPLSLYVWSFTICRHITVNKMCWVRR